MVSPSLTAAVSAATLVGFLVTFTLATERNLRSFASCFWSRCLGHVTVQCPSKEPSSEWLKADNNQSKSGIRSKTVELVFDWLEWLRSARMHSERKEEGRFIEGGGKNIEPGQLFTRMLPIIFRGRTDQILGAYATKTVAISSPAMTELLKVILFTTLLRYNLLEF